MEDRIERLEREMQDGPEGVDIIIVRELSIREPDDTFKRVRVDGPFDPHAFEVVHSSDGGKYKVWKAKPKPASD